MNLVRIEDVSDNLRRAIQNNLPLATVVLFPGSSTVADWCQAIVDAARNSEQNSFVGEYTYTQSTLAFTHDVDAVMMLMSH